MFNKTTSMKKLMIVLVAVTCTGLLHAQNLSFGPTAGFGHSWSSYDKPSPYDGMFHPSYNIGGKIVYSFVTSWGISADVKFSSEGQTFGIDKDNKIVGRLNYIRVPLQGIYFFGKYGDAVRPKISLGPSFGFAVGGKTKVYEDGEVISETKTKDNAETFDFGVTGAIGANFRIAKATWLNADIAYYHGFLDVPTADVSAKNRGIGINVGVLFPLGTLKPGK